LKPLLISLFALTALAQTEQIEMTGGKLVREGSTLRGSQHVQAKAGPYVLQADEGIFNRDTGELDLRGHVRATLPARADHNLFRYDSHTLVTDQPVTISADQVHLKNSTLQASGHIGIRTVGAQLTADRMVMYLTSAEARLEGNIQSTVQGTGKRGHPDFPAEIIK
jgi:lipopolysaccharide export system protein LptA